MHLQNCDYMTNILLITEKCKDSLVKVLGTTDYTCRKFKAIEQILILHNSQKPIPEVLKAQM